MYTKCSNSYRDSNNSVCRSLIEGFNFLLDDTVKLSRALSRDRLAHSIRNLYEEFDRRVYDNLEHRNLYVLDLDCDYAIEVLRQVTNVL